MDTSTAVTVHQTEINDQTVDVTEDLTADLHQDTKVVNAKPATCTEDGYTGDTVCAACGKDALSKGAHAGNLVREVAKAAGGNGGGKPDLAMAGGKDIAAVDKALGTAEQVITAQIGV